MRRKTLKTGQYMCRYCTKKGHVYVFLNKGCYCTPIPHFKWLCTDHFVNAKPLGEMLVIRVDVTT